MAKADGYAAAYAGGRACHKRLLAFKFTLDRAGRHHHGRKRGILDRWKKLLFIICSRMADRAAILPVRHDLVGYIVDHAPRKEKSAGSGFDRRRTAIDPRLVPAEEPIDRGYR